MTERIKERFRGRFGHRLQMTVFDWVGLFGVLLVVLVLLLAYVFRIVGVVGDSMLPTLHSGDRLLMRYVDSEADFARGDVVVIGRYSDTPLIKRVIAVGGDTVSIADGVVYVNHRICVEPYAQYDDTQTDVDRYFKEATVPVGYVFVLGDNRDHSKDSRSDEVGLVPVQDVVGRVTFCVWPLSSLGAV